MSHNCNFAVTNSPDARPPVNSGSVSPPAILLHMRKHRLESILQRPHIRIRVLLQLKRIWDDFDGPVHLLRGLTRFEAEIEIAWKLAVYAEGVH